MAKNVTKTTKPATATTAGWDEKTTERLFSMYSGWEDNVNFPKIAAALGKTVPMVRGKLTSAGKYVKAPETAKVGGASAERKIAIVNDIADKLYVAHEDFAPFEKSSKPALELLRSILDKIDLKAHFAKDEENE